MCRKCVSMYVVTKSIGEKIYRKRQDVSLQPALAYFNNGDV